MSQVRPIFLTDTLSGKRSSIDPIEAGKIRLYSCGPTVYGYTHNGNARAALSVDLVVRSLEYFGYEVNFAQNITDIDDKIIKVSQEESVEWTEITKRFEEQYLGELKTLGTRVPDHRPHATENVKEMLKLIADLIEKDAAYVSETPFGTDVYFRVRNFKGYGKLSHRDIDDLQAGARIEVGEQKQDPLDFALWKAAKPGEPSWESAYGSGRPGWHLECSAMIRKIFPEGIDIHMGGNDLVFPHHENEIAQSESLDDCDCLSRYWIHNGMLTIQKSKMSKSLGNTFLTKDFLANFGPEVLRIMIFQHQIRGPIDFSEESILRSEGLVERLYKCKAKALEAGATSERREARDATESCPKDLGDLQKKMEEALADDFNSAKALGFALKAARICFKEDSPEYWKRWGEEALYLMDTVLALTPKEPKTAIDEIRARRLNRMGISEERANEIDSRLAERERLRKEKKFDESDKIRDSLIADGILVMDGPDGSCWSV